ncbi:hypothetical protein GWI33_021037 [Rhynchophorus ferrugineus]|uniref:Large ribosomal subunit protein mL66 n=1 Tax=Rhynchophorus ferrugineus TaxID=354439 RepID=A0A834HVI3_RHYFE|nr:hypothetical protein GWI33_021037 [Rhynchophorus ferrugineus]
MNITKRIVQNYIGKTIFNNETRRISIFPILNVKEIHEVQEGNQLIIYGQEKASPREPYLLKNNQTEKCPVCASGLNIKHTDVLILSQFVRLDGCMLPRRITGLCGKQQKRISTLVSMAQKAGLMPNLTPAWSKKDPKKRIV